MFPDGYGKYIFLMAQILWIWNGPDSSAVHARENPIRLQYISEVYRKQPYISVPTAWIEPTLRNEFLRKLQAKIEPEWEISLLPFRGQWFEGDWIYTLSCHPAANIQFVRKKEDREDFAILLLYPESYRPFIEDPFAKNPPPILYLGSARRVAFYYFPSHRVHARLVQDITGLLRLQKSY